jgi:hypothetical protein
LIILKFLRNKTKEKMRRPGLEPGFRRWQRLVITTTLSAQCALKCGHSSDLSISYFRARHGRICRVSPPEEAGRGPGPACRGRFRPGRLTAGPKLPRPQTGSPYCISVPHPRTAGFPPPTQMPYLNVTQSL